MDISQMCSGLKRFSLSVSLFVIFLTGFSSNVAGQFYMSGTSKAGTKWNYIENDRYKLIYPSETDSLARRYFHLLNVAGMVNDSAMGIKGLKYPVVLYPYTPFSNGTVSYAPKIMELYTMPDPSTYSQNWEEQLALHETRHKSQISHFTKGAFRPLSWFFGQQITGLALGVYSTRWEMEGDAVLAETIFSKAGRGRDASFLEYYRMSLLSGGGYSRDQWRYGSTKDYIPNVYAYGYMTYSSGVLLSGDSRFPEKTFSTLSKKMYTPSVVEKAYKGVSGYTHKELFTKGMEEYGAFWKEDMEKRGGPTEFTPLLSLKEQKPKYYTEYRSPVSVGTDSVICIMVSYSNNTSLVLLSGGKERVLRPFSHSVNDLVSDGGDLLYYTEAVQDKRWEKTGTKGLYSYNIKNGRIAKLPGEGYYYNPAVDDATGKLAVIEYFVTGGSSVRILLPEDYSCERVIAAPENGQLTYLAWCNGVLYASVIEMSGAALYSLSGRDGVYEWKREIEGQRSKIAFLKGYDSKIYFMSDIDGVNNIYSYSPENKEVARMTNSEFGASYPLPAQERLYYSNLSLNSRLPVYKPLEEVSQGHSVKLSDGRLTSSYSHVIVDSISGDIGVADKITGWANKKPGSFNEGSNVREGRYRRGMNLFRFHSWAPFYYNVNRLMNLNYDDLYEELSPGATVYSQNDMGTAVTMLGYSYRRGFHAAHASFNYYGWLPVLQFSVDYNSEQRYSYLLGSEDGKPVLSSGTSSRPYLEMRALAYIPFRFNSRGWYRSLVPQVQWQYENTGFENENSGSKVVNQKIIMGLQYSQSLPIAIGAIYSKWGFGLSMLYSTPVERSQFLGDVASASLTAYLPGAVGTHGIRITAGYQKQKNKYLYSDNLLPEPRGYSDDHYGEEYYKIGVDYALPVNFKGLDLGFLAYLKQLQIVPFFDMAGVRQRGREYRNINSAGCDLLVYGHLLKLGTPVKIGLRQAVTDKGYSASMLFTVEW